MEIRLYNEIIKEINELGKINGITIDDYVNLSNELLENLEKVKQIDMNKLYNNKDVTNRISILSEINTYKRNEKYIRSLNKYLTNKQKELSYTLQYQRHKKLKLHLNKKKSIYSNK